MPHKLQKDQKQRSSNRGTWQLCWIQSTHCGKRDLHSLSFTWWYLLFHSCKSAMFLHSGAIWDGWGNYARSWRLQTFSKHMRSDVGQWNIRNGKVILPTVNCPALHTCNRMQFWKDGELYSVVRFLKVDIYLLYFTFYLSTMWSLTPSHHQITSHFVIYFVYITSLLLQILFL